MNSSSSGIVADIMRRTRANYHYAIRQLKKQSDQLSKNAMAQSIANNNYRDLWKETSKIGNTESTTSTCIDNKINDDNITKVFFDKYNILYNSVRYNDNSLNMLLADNLSDVKQHCMDCSDDDYVYSHKHVITIENVPEAIHKLKSGKSDWLIAWCQIIYYMVRIVCFSILLVCLLQCYVMELHLIIYLFYFIF